MEQENKIRFLRYLLILATISLTMVAILSYESATCLLKQDMVTTQQGAKTTLQVGSVSVNPRMNQYFRATNVTELTIPVNNSGAQKATDPVLKLKNGQQTSKLNAIRQLNYEPALKGIKNRDHPNPRKNILKLKRDPSTTHKTISSLANTTEYIALSKRFNDRRKDYFKSMRGFGAKKNSASSTLPMPEPDASVRRTKRSQDNWVDWLYRVVSPRVTG